MATTAQQLIAYRKELIQGGFTPAEAHDLVQDAAQTLVMKDGLKVATPSQGTDFVDQHTDPSLIRTTPGP